MIIFFQAKEKMTILMIVGLSIVLPTMDTFSDINLVVKMYLGIQYCDDWDDDWKCLEDHLTNATIMLIPFLLNYIVCFITFFRKEKNKKLTIIFALLNIYPQFGENNHYKMNHCNHYFQYFRGSKDHQPPG